MIDLVSLDIKALNLSASRGVTKVQLTSVDIYNFLVILTYRQYAKKIGGMVYIKNNISEYLCTAELIFLWFYTNTHFFLILQKKQKDISLSGFN